MSLRSSQVGDKILGGWLGKLIGNEIGRILEGWDFNEIVKKFGEMNYYVHKVNGFGSDDSDYIVLSLHTLESRGISITLRDIAEEWIKHLKYAYTAEKIALENLKRGLFPPLSAIFKNPY